MLAYHIKLIIQIKFSPFHTQVATCKAIQESPGFQIPRCGFRIPDSGLRIPCLWIPDSTLWIPDSMSVDSGFHIHGFRIPWIPLAGFRIPQTKITWILDSGLPYMGRHKLISHSFYMKRTKSMRVGVQKPLQKEFFLVEFGVNMKIPAN